MPIDFDPFLDDRRQHFCGRDWLFDEILSASDAAVLVVGDPGVGKSAIVAEFVHRYSDRVLAWHCCQADRQSTLEPGRFVRSMAAMIASRLPAYAAALEQPAVANAFDADPLSAFETGILAPLAAMFSGPPSVGTGHSDGPSASAGRLSDGPSPWWLVVDALDEAGTWGIVEVLASSIERFPSWLHLMATTRKEPKVLARLRGLRARQLDAHSLEDVEAFLGARSSVALVTRSGGNFLYAQQALGALERGAALPGGLAGLYEESFAHIFGQPEETWPSARRVLEALLAALEPLTEEQLASVLDVEIEELRRSMAPLGDYVRMSDGVCRLFHRSLADWLTDPSQGNHLYLVELPRARRRLLEWCRRWRVTADRYALRWLPAHLYEARATDELAALLGDETFAARRQASFDEPGLGAEVAGFLTASLFSSGHDDQIVALAVTSSSRVRDGVVSGLRRFPDNERTPFYRPRVERIVDGLLTVGPKPVMLRRPRLDPAVLNARQAGMRLACAHGLAGPLMRATGQRDRVVAAMLVPFLYRFWKDHREVGWTLLDDLAARALRKSGVPDLGIAGGMSMAIVAQHFDDGAVMARLHDVWRGIVKQTARSPVLRLVGKQWVLTLLTRGLGFVMGRQPDYQPFNLKEVALTYSRPPSGRQETAGLLASIEHPERGFGPVIERLMDRREPFDLYRMVVAERVLVYHGVRTPGPLFEALGRLHDEGRPWFRHSLCYVAFHVLWRVARASKEWLTLFARITRETVIEGRGTWRSDLGEYALVPHMAWAEVIFERHEFRTRGAFIADFHAEAVRLGDVEFARRTIAACDDLALVYRRYGLALEALRGAVETADPVLTDSVVDVLANIRFYDEQAVDRMVGDSPLKARVQTAPPSMLATDFPGGIDDFLNHSMIHSDGFRAEMVNALRQAGEARTPTDLFRRLLAWGTAMVAGEVVL